MKFKTGRVDINDQNMLYANVNSQRLDTQSKIKISLESHCFKLVICSQDLLIP